MGREYLKDIEFLKALDEIRIKEHFVKLQILNFQEQPLRMIQGIATAGNITVNGSSAVRRTINLTMVSYANENDLNNIDNIISANKKVKVELGIKNPFSTYAYYGDIVWFPAGMFLITEASASTSATNSTITLKGKDKMCLLDGTCGGVLPSTVTFHERQNIDKSGNVYIEKVPIFTIIKECVRHYGKEIEQNILINNVDLVAKQVVKYIGNTPVWFSDDFKNIDITNKTPEGYTRKYEYGQDIGYFETDFTYPGELVFSAGETVTSVLDKIIQTIGNYEYFYDLEGRFIFQEKKNYLNHYYTPIIELGDYFYIKAFSDSKYYTTFQNSKDIISYFNNPKYDNIKNDFVVWGTNTDSNGVIKNIKYHLAIDEKPRLDLALQNMWEVSNGEGQHLYYFFNYSDEDYNSNSTQLIKLNYDINLKEDGIKDFIKDYVNNNFIKNNTSTITTYSLYIKLQWGMQIKYYKIKVLDQKIEDIIYLEDNNQYIPNKKIVLGILQNEKFIALSIKEINHNFSLGYMKNEKWNEVYNLGKNKDISIEEIQKIIDKIILNNENKEIIRIFVFDNDYDEKCSFITLKNSNSLNYNTQELYFNDNKVIFDYNFSDIVKTTNNSTTTTMEFKDRETLIKSLYPYYLKELENLKHDIKIIYELQGNSLLPWLDNNNENFKIFKKDLNDSKKIIELIYNYGYKCNLSQDDLIGEIQKYHYNNKIKDDKALEEFILKIIIENPVEPKFDFSESFIFTKIGGRCEEWREELYRQALLNQESAGEPGYYDEELLAFWRNNFDTLNTEWKSLWDLYFNNEEQTNPWTGWNPAIYKDPSLLTFWLDFLDNESLVTKYSINQIGRRTIAKNYDNIKMLYKLEVPDVIFFVNDGSLWCQNKAEEYKSYGQSFCAILPDQEKYFTSSATGSTAFDLIREMLYLYLCYNISITINCVPKYYLEPNNLIYISDKKSNIQGDFVITQYTIPLNYNGTMTINATQALTRI